MGDELRDLDEIEACAAAATPGPWFISSEWSVRTGRRDDELVACVQYKDHGRDAAFIAVARTDVPVLCARVRALAAEAAALRAALTRIRDVTTVVCVMGDGRLCTADGDEPCSHCVARDALAALDATAPGDPRAGGG
jgi:hypothetical protein